MRKQDKNRVIGLVKRIALIMKNGRGSDAKTLDLYREELARIEKEFVELMAKNPNL